MTSKQNSAEVIPAHGGHANKVRLSHDGSNEGVAQAVEAAGQGPGRAAQADVAAGAQQARQIAADASSTR
jgi:hypothetical protein